MDPMGYAQVFEPHYDSLRNLWPKHCQGSSRPPSGREGSTEPKMTGWRIVAGLAISIVIVNIYIYYINISKKFGEHRKTPQINSVGQFRFDIKASTCKGKIFCRRNIHLPVIG